MTELISKSFSQSNDLTCEIKLQLLLSLLHPLLLLAFLLVPCVCARARARICSIFVSSFSYFVFLLFLFLSFSFFFSLSPSPPPFFLLFFKHILCIIVGDSVIIGNGRRRAKETRSTKEANSDVLKFIHVR